MNKAMNEISEDVISVISPNQCHLWYKNAGDDEIFYYHLDHLNSTKVVTNKAGEVILEYEYRAFGTELDRIGTDKNRFSYIGREFDEEINLYYVNARYYDATIGRFINVDPIQDGFNWYIYANNNPLKFVDPSGLSEETNSERQQKIKDMTNSSYYKHSVGYSADTGILSAVGPLAPIYAAVTLISKLTTGKSIGQHLASYSIRNVDNSSKIEEGVIDISSGSKEIIETITEGKSTIVIDPMKEINEFSNKIEAGSDKMKEGSKKIIEGIIGIVENTIDYGKEVQDDSKKQLSNFTEGIKEIVKSDNSENNNIKNDENN